MSVVLIRTVVLYVVIVFALRIMGKRQLGELQPSELVVTILVSNIATLSIEDTNIPLLGSILPIFILVSCEVLVSIFILKWPWARKIISGNPRIVIKNGIINQKEMKNLRWSLEDLTEQLRTQGVFDLSEVSFAVVETSGALSAYQKYKARAITPDMVDLPDRPEEDAPPTTVISDGVLVKDALNYCNLSQEWLDNTLRQEGVAMTDVFLFTCDHRARYHLVKKAGKGGKKE